MMFRLRGAFKSEAVGETHFSLCLGADSADVERLITNCSRCRQEVRNRAKFLQVFLSQDNEKRFVSVTES